jgi:fucose permease
MNNWQALVPVTVAAACVFGMLVALLGGIKLPLARQLGLDETGVGGLVALFGLALIPLVLVSGFLIGPLGLQVILAAGSVLAALGLALLSLSTRYAHAVVSVLFVAAGAACVNTAGTVLMPQAFFEGRPAASLNLGYVFFGLGALMTPALADLLGRLLGCRRMLGVLAAVCLAPAAITLIQGGVAAAPTASAGSLGVVIANPVLWLAAAVFFLYSPIEGALGSWATSFLTELGYHERRAALWLSGFWVAFLASRLLAAWLQQKRFLPTGSDGWTILVLALAAAVALGNLVGTNKGITGRRVLLVAGAALGPLFPTLIGFLFEHVDPSAYGVAYGVLYALGATGNVVLPPLVGSYAKRATTRRALRLPTGVALVLVAAALALAVAS